jgi:hypothetical protein
MTSNGCRWIEAVRASSSLEERANERPRHSSVVVRAERDDVGRAGGAGEYGGGVVVRVGVRLGARRLEQPGVGRGLALLRPAEPPRAAVLRRAVRRAGAAAPDDGAPLADGEPGGAHAVEVADAAGGHAVGALPVVRRHGDGEVVPVHQAHVVEVLRRGRGRERHLRQRCRRRAPGPVAVERAAAVARRAAAPPRRVELAALPAPHAARPPGREADGGGAVGRQLHPAARQDLLARARLDARPHRLWHRLYSTSVAADAPCARRSAARTVAIASACAIARRALTAPCTLRERSRSGQGCAALWGSCVFNEAGVSQ